MKVRYKGTGTRFVEGVGHLSHGETAEMPDALGKALVAECPGDWEEAGAGGKKQPKGGGGGE